MNAAAKKYPRKIDALITHENALGDTAEQKAFAAAMAYLGPEIRISSICDNAVASAAYGRTVPDCWRVCFSLRAATAHMVGGGSPYILIDKSTLHVIGRGLEQGE